MRELLIVLMCLWVSACSGREVPASFPKESPASSEAVAAPPQGVTTALEQEPPLPGEGTQGWSGLEPAVPTSQPAHPNKGAPTSQPAHHEGMDHSGHAMEPPAGSPVYVCPMHSDVVSDHEGSCPKCGMTMELKK
jgi:P-type Cu+ transporter